MENDISNVLNQFKDILNKNSSNTSNNSSNSNSNTNLNITPEMITSIAENLKNNNFNNNLSNHSNKTSSSQNIFTQNSEANSNLDIDTILKIKNIIDTFNQKDDARANLLYSLKPYLRESRQKKIDQYVNLFKISAITNLFKKEKGDNN